MDLTIYPAVLSGTVEAIPSKSQAHRLLICSAFSDKETFLRCPETNQDIEATAGCLRALGAEITRVPEGYRIQPVTAPPKQADLFCGESGSTLRFLLPVAGALGTDACFHMKGRLPKRPLSPLWEEMNRMGCHLSRPTPDTVRCTGKLSAGEFRIDGSVSSQFISGLLLAAALIDGESRIQVIGKLESAPYAEMTLQALRTFGVSACDFQVCGSLISPGRLCVEGDWSNGAFFLTAAALGSRITVTGLSCSSCQGDRKILSLLPQLKTHTVISAADVPDLVPIMAVAAGAGQGAVFTDIQRLRLKESDRVETVAAMLRNLGCRVTTAPASMEVFPARFQPCTVDAAGDHRIAMAAAIAATAASGPVTVLGAQCVAKSYPRFWEDYQKLGGYYEQHIR